MNRRALPLSVTSFVGREREIEHLVERLDGSRLLTLVGPGGIGKTRLALEIAREAGPRFPDGVRFVELAGSQDPRDVAPAVAESLGIREEAGRTLAGSIAGTLADSRILLVLDNCEHLVEASAALATSLLGATSALRILVTSREALAVPGEAVHSVASLSLPRDASGPDESEAVRLFVERARNYKAGFTADGRHAAALAELCRRLEGIPLAIELAAARVKVLSVEQILARTDDRFRLLSAGGSTAPRRQQTLRAAVDWSYELLTDGEKTALGRLSVFAGGFSLEAVEAVSSGDGVDRFGVLNLLARLVDKSLVVTDEVDGIVRYRMLETIRQYAREKLAASGEEEERLRAHRDWFVELAERAVRERALDDGNSRWHRALDLDRDNLVAAVQWSIHAARDADESLRLACALAPLWMVRGFIVGGRRWLEEALALGGSPRLRANALYAVANGVMFQGEYDAARSWTEQAVEHWRVAGDRPQIVRGLTQLAVILGRLGDLDRAFAVLEESLALGEEARLPAVAAGRAWFNLGVLAVWTGDLERSRDGYQRSLPIWRAENNLPRVAATLTNLGETMRLAGDFARARELQDEAVAVAREAGDAHILGEVMFNLGQAICDEGDPDAALAIFDEARGVYFDVENVELVLDMIEHYAYAHARRGDFERAFILLVASDATREAIHTTRPAVYEAENGRRLGAVVASLAPARVEVLRARGRGMSPEKALALASESSGRTQ